MTHDPLCLLPTPMDTRCAYCELITRVRADERERLYAVAKADSGAMFGIVLAAEFIEEEVREHLRAQVEALDCHTDDPLANDVVERADVLRLLGGESDG